MRITVPRGACDTHIHFYDEKVPGAPGTFLPGHFGVKEYRELQKRLGLERVIVVQPNAYADDNTVTVNAIKELGKGAKGVAVVKPGVKDAELERLTKAGICAIRIMTLHGGGRAQSRSAEKGQEEIIRGQGRNYSGPGRLGRLTL